MDAVEQELRGAVEHRFATTGAATPGWPDPHDGRDPAEEEYSRLLDPAKYRILAARVQAWLDVLVDRGAARPRSSARSRCR